MLDTFINWRDIFDRSGATLRDYLGESHSVSM